jgi:hypothetical protein
MFLDSITEQIAHFIGQFSIKVEEARMRDQYNQFRALQDQEADQQALDGVAVNIRAPHAFLDVTPGVNYVSIADPILARSVDTYVAYDRFREEFDANYVPDSRPPEFNPLRPTPNGQDVIRTIEAPGSIAVLTIQKNDLYDNDYVGDDLITSAQLANQSRIMAGLGDLVHHADGLSVLGDYDKPATEDAIAALVKQLKATTMDLSESSSQSGDDYSFTTHDVSHAILNGAEMATPLKLKDFMHKDAPAEKAPDPVQVAHGEGTLKLGSDETIETGGNTLVNEVLLPSSWTVSPVIAVVHDYISIDAISQRNVHSDVDTVNSVLSTFGQGDMANVAYNLAAINAVSQAPSATSSSASGPLTFPKNWTVTTIEGNLVLLNWTEQINKIIDNDIVSVAQRSGTTAITTGDNTAYNSKFLLELGHSYDLVIIGGSLYRANVIDQTNILLDDDWITTGNLSGTHSSHDNLLWNEASITHVGNVQFTALPPEYLAAAMRLAAGDESVSNAILSDPAFAGIANLRVLYIKQDLLTFNYVKQTNILADSDEIRLGEGNLSDVANPNLHINTGQNELINIAQIIDYGVDGTVKVGGEVYTDAVLHQSGLIADQSPILANGSGALVSEAVVFLADDMLSDDASHHEGSAGPMVTETVSVDVMQNMLS